MNLDIYGWAPWSSMDSPEMCKIMCENVHFSVNSISWSKESFIPNDCQISIRGLISHDLGDPFTLPSWWSADHNQGNAAGPRGLELRSWVAIRE